MERIDRIRERLGRYFPGKQAEVLSEVITEAYNDLVKVSDFQELKEIVRDLAKAQKCTESRLEELAEAQRRTETRVEELAEAQKRTEERLDSLTVKVEELAEAQRRTETRVEELAEAQKRTEERLDSLTIKVEELAEAQRRTEVEIQKLSKALRDTRKELGGLSHTVGYSLENESYKALPSLLKTKYGIEVTGKLKRDYVRDAEGQYIEINVIGKGIRDGTEVTIIGESKVQLSQKGVDQFIRKKLKRLHGVFANMFPLIITHMISAPDVEQYARNKGIAIFYSYEF